MWSADGLTPTFKLREGVVFHDGKPFDAAAAKANLDRHRTLPNSRRRAVDEAAQRQELYRRALSIYLDDRSLLGLHHHYNWIWRMSRSVQGFKPHRDGLIHARGLRLGNQGR